METRIYYGEYSLSYWIELILTKKIQLPPYQRCFVWTEELCNNLLTTISEGRYVPPITLGSYLNNQGQQSNLIIDGQQRLTSILLAYLGIFPDKEKYKSKMHLLATGEETDEEEDVNQYDNVLEWTFAELVEKGRSKEEIKAKLKKGNYKEMSHTYANTFWENNCLGFTYIVPSGNSQEQQKFYTKTFREINTQGIKLLNIESRRSLYFLDGSLNTLFEPTFAASYKIKLVAETPQLDFVRYLALIANYVKVNNFTKVAKGYAGKKLESFIEKYIYSVVGEGGDALFQGFDTVFPNRDYQGDLDILTLLLADLEIPKEFSSIIEMDLYFFGLIYLVLFQHKTIDISRKDVLKEHLNRKIEVFKAEDGGKHSHTPAQFKYLRRRMQESVAIYNDFSKER